MTSQLIGTSKNVSAYTASGDASGLQNETVVYKEGSNSIRFNVTLSSGVAGVSSSFNSINDGLYKSKYFFYWVYLSGIPTSIKLKFGNDSSNYLYDTVDTQFSGQDFKVNDWNLVAIDLNTASTQGTITSSAFDYQQIQLNDAPTGVYYLDNSYLRQWTLIDYWYYSNNNIYTEAGNYQSYFRDEDIEAYNIADMLIGELEFADVVMYEALMLGFTDQENEILYKKVEKKLEDAWQKFFDIYPDLVPLITTSKYDFESDYQATQWNDNLR